MVVLCLADWVLVEDFGFFGGLGTDPNSMIPHGPAGGGGYLALTGPPRSPPSRKRRRSRSGSQGRGLTGRSTGRGRAQAARAIPPGAAGAGLGGFGAAGTRAVLTVWALVIVFLGAAPMAMAQTSRSADPIIAQAVDGDAAPLDDHRRPPSS